MAFLSRKAKELEGCLHPKLGLVTQVLRRAAFLGLVISLVVPERGEVPSFAVFFARPKRL
jgi:hypothetical protein